ncbi:MAG: sigma-70 family RNA polymerase sigma factor [Planctomycetes bacterium]|nr:sigma-70 family RNA polymerase sigma factor [Planctomycetota bacterium]MBI3845363.1 sigma-70 family RNA polymerase sigma factor [Planctomycetota bacterium]
MSDRRGPIDPETLLANAAWVRGLARQLVADEARADDVVQETWLAAIQHPPRHAGALRSWLRTVVAHAARRAGREEAHRPRRERAAARPEAVPSAAELVERVSLQRRVVEEVVTLGEPYRSTVLLHFFEELTSEEIARRTGVPAATVRVRLMRALDQLRRRLDDAHDGDRRAWSLALIPIALPKDIPPVAPITAFSKVNVAAVAATVVVLLGVAWWVTRDQSDRATPVNVAANSGARRRAATTASTASEPSDRERASVASVATNDGVNGHVVDRDERDIAGARVFSFPDDVEEAVDLAQARADSGPLRVATTDDRGRFTIALGGHAPFHTLVVDATGFAPAGVESVRPADDRTITLDPASSIDGVAKNLDGEPVAGARVAWRGLFLGAALERSAVSGKNGAFHIEGLPSATWKSPTGPYDQSLLATADGWASLCLAGPSFIAWRDGAERSLYLLRGATLRGRVVDAETGEPLANARVIAWSNDDEYSHTTRSGAWLRNPISPRVLGEATTATDGSFAFAHMPAWGVNPAGDHSLTMTARHLGGLCTLADGYAVSKKDLDLPDNDATIDVELRCCRTATVRGRVVDTFGTPVSGARIDIRRFPPIPDVGFVPVLLTPHARRTLTDASGAYELADVPAWRTTASVVAIGASVLQQPYNRSSAPVEVNVLADRVANAPDVVISTVPAAVFHVADEHGQPIWGALLRRDGFGNPTGRTDEDGTALMVFESIQSARVFVEAVGHAIAISPEFAPSATDPPEVRVMLEPEHRVSGRVFYRDGAAVDGATVIVDRGDIPIDSLLPSTSSSPRTTPLPPLACYAQITADADGRFEAHGLPPGPYHIIAAHYWTVMHPHAFISNVPSDATGLTLEIPRDPESEPTARVEGSIHDGQSGTPILRFEVALYNDRTNRTTTLSGSPGRFSLESVPFGTWNVYARAPGYAPLVQRDVVVGQGGASPPLDLRLERGVTLHGVARLPDGACLNDAKIVFLGVHGGGSEYAPVASDGSFATPGLKPGWEYAGTIYSGGEGGRTVTFASPIDRRLSIPEGVSDLDLELPFVAAGTIQLELRGERLFGRGRGNPTKTESQAKLAAETTLEIRTREGALAWEWKHVTFDNWGMAIPPDDYVVRLTVPGIEPIEKRVTVTPSTTAKVEFDVP